MKSIKNLTEDERMVFLIACGSGEISKINELINDVDIDFQGGSGWTGLMRAVSFTNKIEVVKILIDHGAR